jgi:hypothetical protein
MIKIKVGKRRIYMKNNCNKKFLFIVILLFIICFDLKSQYQITNDGNVYFPIVFGYLTPIQENLVKKNKVEKISEGSRVFNIKGQIISEFNEDIYQNVLTTYEYNDFDSISKIVILKTFGSYMKYKPIGTSIPKKDSVFTTINFQYDINKCLSTKEIYDDDILINSNKYLYDSLLRLKNIIEMEFDTSGGIKSADSVVYKYYNDNIEENTYNRSGSLLGKVISFKLFNNSLKKIEKNNSDIQTWLFDKENHLCAYYKYYYNSNNFQFFQYKYLCRNRKIQIIRYDFDFSSGIQKYYYEARLNRAGRLKAIIENDDYRKTKNISNFHYSKNGLLDECMNKFVDKKNKKNNQIIKDNYFYEFY